MDKHRTAYAWLQSGRALRLSTGVSDAFDDYLMSLPWAGTTGLDWSRMTASREINLVGKSAADVCDWAKTTRVGIHDHMVIWYSRADGGIVIPLREGIAALDELYQAAPGPRFSFGADVTEGAVQPAFADLLQYGYGDLLIGTA